MKILSFFAGLALVTTTIVIADDTPSPASFLKTFSLDERTSYAIPVALAQGVTTLVFPEPPQNFAAARIAFVEAGQTVPDFIADDRIDFVMLTHRGSTSASLRAIRPQAHDTLSVFLDGKVYQLFLHAEEKQPLLTVQFHFRPSVSAIQSESVSPNRLIDCLTRAKAYPILIKSYPDELAEVTRVVANRIITYPDFRVQISEVFRFETEDTLVFHLLLENQTDHDLTYQPNEIAVRVEPQTQKVEQAPPIYDASIVDASGVMPPRSVTTAWFAITGTRDGGRNELDPARNLFTVLVPRVAFPATKTDASGSAKKSSSSLDPKNATTH